MTNFDPDLIAALAEGSLDPDRAESLEREIAADPAAAAELAAQRAALAMLRDAPEATLTIDERALLGSNVAEALGVTREPATPPPAKERRRVPWPAIAVAGASLVALVAIVPTIGMLSTGGDDAADVALPAATVAEDQSADAGAESLGTAREGGDEPNASPQTTDAPMFQEAPEAILESDTAVADDGAGADGGFPTTTMAPPPEAAFSGLDPGLAAALEDFAALARDADPGLEICRAEAVEVLGEEISGDLTATLTMLNDGTEAVVWFIPIFEQLMEAAAFDTTDCGLLFLNG